MTEPNPETNPEGTVDALEERVLGERHDQQRDESTDVPAFEHDVDPADGPGAHRATEPPA